MGTAPVIEVPAAETDLPAVPGGNSDLPAVPATDSMLQVPSEEMPPVEASESAAEANAAASEAMVDSTREAAGDEQQPAVTNCC